MGRKFFHFDAKLPDYLLSNSMKLNRLTGKAPRHILDFIQADVADFITSVCGKEEDKQKMIFQALDGFKHFYVFMPPCQATASGLRMDIL